MPSRPDPDGATARSFVGAPLGSAMELGGSAITE